MSDDRIVNIRGMSSPLLVAIPQFSSHTPMGTTGELVGYKRVLLL